MNQTRVIILVASIVIIGLLAYWAIQFLEIVEIDKEILPSLAARRDDWLAIERSLTPDPGVVRYEEASEIDLSRAAVVALYVWELPALDSRTLIDWIGAGGRLILMFEFEDEEERTELPYHSLFNGLDPEYPDDVEDDSDNIADKLAGARKYLSSLPVGISVDMQVNFNQVHADEVTAVYFADGDKKAVARVYGDGGLFACGYPLALYNEGLKRQENRALADFIFGQEFETGVNVWLPARPGSLNVEIEGLNVAPVLLSVLIVCIVLFWMGGPRLGSVIYDEVPHRRSLRERFQAEGYFLWRHGAGNRMLGISDSEKHISKRAFIDAVNSHISSKQSGAKKNHDH